MCWQPVREAPAEAKTARRDEHSSNGVVRAAAEWISRHLRWSARSNCKTYVRDLAQSLMFPGWRGEKGSVSGRLPNPRVHVVDDTYWYWNNVVRGLSEDNKDYGGKDWKLRVQRDNPRLRAKRTYFFLGSMYL